MLYALRVSFLLAALALSKCYSQAQNGAENYQTKRIVSSIEFSIGTSLKLATGASYLKHIRVPKFGFATRLGLTHELNSRTHLSLDVSYIQKGLKFRVYSNDGSTPPKSIKVVNDNTLNYLELAFIPRYRLVRSGQLYCGLGPYVGYLINSRFRQQYSENGKLIYSTGSIINNNDNYKDFDAGASIVVGSNLYINKKIEMIIRFNYSIGLVEINEPAIDIVKNNSFSLQIGLSLNGVKNYGVNH